MWSYVERLDKVRKFVASVMRYNGSAGSSQDALNNLQEIEDYIKELLEEELSEEDFDLEVADEESEEVMALMERVEKLEEENDLLAEALAEYEVCEKVSEASEPFSKIEVPEDVWCSDCFGTGWCGSGVCTTCDGVGRKKRG